MTEEEVFFRNEISGIIQEVDKTGEPTATNIIVAKIDGFLNYLRVYGYLHHPYMDNYELYKDYINKLQL